MSINSIIVSRFCSHSCGRQTQILATPQTNSARKEKPMAARTTGNSVTTTTTTTESTTTTPVHLAPPAQEPAQPVGSADQRSNTMLWMAVALAVAITAALFLLLDNVKSPTTHAVPAATPVLTTRPAAAPLPIAPVPVPTDQEFVSTLERKVLTDAFESGTTLRDMTFAKELIFETLDKSTEMADATAARIRMDQMLRPADPVAPALAVPSKPQHLEVTVKTEPLKVDVQLPAAAQHAHVAHEHTVDCDDDPFAAVTTTTRHLTQDQQINLCQTTGQCTFN